MENVLRRIRFCADEAGQAADAREKAKTRERLLEDLAETRRRLACNDAWFQLETDDALVEACVYERQSLLAVNLTGVFTGVSLPLSPLSLGVAGTAGLPRVTLLLLLNLLLRP